MGPRRSALSKSNRNAHHPINAILNYAYSVLHAQVKMKITAASLDPTIGLSHIQHKYRDALVLDRMHPLRPIVASIILGLLLNETLTPGEFTITKKGYCRLNPQPAKTIVQSIDTKSVRGGRVELGPDLVGPDPST